LKKEVDIILASELFGELWIWNDIEITGISDDSRRIKPGYAFIALKGNEKDGYDYISDAVEKGASVILSYKNAQAAVPVIEAENIREMVARTAKKFYFSDEKKFKLIGVTGTNGKTTVTHIVKDILESCGKTVGIIGTNGIFIRGERKDLYKNTPTTPNAPELWQMFDVMVKSGIEYIVMEVSSHALSLDRVYGCEFDVGVFTNLTREHLDFHETMEEYRRAKEKLFGISKIGVINIDDIAGTKIYSNIKGKKVSVGFDDADFTIHALSVKEAMSEFMIEHDNEIEKTTLSLPGKFNVYNALLSVACCVGVGIDFKEAVKGLKNVKPVKGRMEKVPLEEEFSVIIDYAHSPDGLEKVIHTLKGCARGRVITLFGCGGDRDRSKRALMGEISGRFSDFTVITSDNPRTENPFLIIEDIVEGIKKTRGRFTVIIDRKKAIEYALSIADKGDMVLLAGKGQEDYQIIGREKIPFDEAGIVREYSHRKKNEKG